MTANEGTPDPARATPRHPMNTVDTQDPEEKKRHNALLKATSSAKPVEAGSHDSTAAKESGKAASERVGEARANTVDTERLEQLRTIGVPFAGATNDDIRVFDCRILLEWATSLTNEAELRGRLSETDYWFGKPVDMNTRPINDKSVADRLAALLKLKGGEEKQ